MVRIPVVPGGIEFVIGRQHPKDKSHPPQEIQENTANLNRGSTAVVAQGFHAGEFSARRFARWMAKGDEAMAAAAAM